MLSMTCEKLEGLLRDYNIIKTGIEHNKIMIDSMELEMELDEVKDEENIRKVKELKLKIELDTNIIKMINNLLNGLYEVDKELIELFYLKNWPWWRIANKLGYSEGWCKAKRKLLIEKMAAFW